QRPTLEAHAAGGDRAEPDVDRRAVGGDCLAADAHDDGDRVAAGRGVDVREVVEVWDLAVIDVRGAEAEVLRQPVPEVVVQRDDAVVVGGVRGHVGPDVDPSPRDEAPRGVGGCDGERYHVRRYEPQLQGLDLGVVRARG